MTGAAAAPPLIGRRRKVKSQKEIEARREERAAHVFMAPWFLGVILISAGPMLASMVLSFTTYRMVGSPRFVGFDNYVRMFSDPRLAQSLRVTFTFVLIGVPLALAFALLIATVLNKGIRGLALYRSVFYLPSLFAGSVAVGVLWRQLFGAQGIVNTVLGWVGIEGRSWVGNPSTALATIILLHVWTFGSSMIIFLAGMRQIPEELYEAASLDGANKWQQFRSVTIPMLTPIIFFNMIMGFINAFQNFTQAFVVSGGTGGPIDSTLVFALYLFQQAFGGAGDMGYASALAWLLVAIVGAITAINFMLSKKWVHYAD